MRWLVLLVLVLGIVLPRFATAEGRLLDADTFAVRSHGDHRIAMSFGILGALSGNQIAVDDPACAAVSYPEFWNDLRRVQQ